MLNEANQESLNSPKKENQEHELVLVNDNHHSFDFVIDTLIEVCHHEVDQAEQCATLTHYKGKCVIKVGKKQELEPLHSEILERGLVVEII